MWRYRSDPERRDRFSELFLDCSREIRFKVLRTEYHDAKTMQEAKETQLTLSEMRPAMRVIGSIRGEGLGMTAWWKSQDIDFASDAVDEEEDPLPDELVVDDESPVLVAKEEDLVVDEHADENDADEFIMEDISRKNVVADDEDERVDDD